MMKIIFRVFLFVMCVSVLGTQFISADVPYDVIEPTDEILQVILERENSWIKLDAGNSINIYMEDAYYLKGYKVISCMEEDGRITTHIYDEINNIRYIYLYHNESRSLQNIEIYDVTDFDMYEKEYYNNKLNKQKLYMEEKLIELDSVRTPTQNEETWWGMKWYRNNSAAQKDIYWRLYNPEHSIPYMYFFTYRDDVECDSAKEYVAFVNEMQAKEESVEGYYDAKVPDALLALTNPTLASIGIELGKVFTDISKATDILEIFGIKDKANVPYSEIATMLYE